MENRDDIILRNVEEILGKERLPALLDKKNPATYCGYEPSGEIHLGHLVTITKLLDLKRAGFHVKVLFADWHAWLNKKGDWDSIRSQVEIWKRGFAAAGLVDAEFIVGTDFQRKNDYMDDVMLLALATTMNRALRSMQQVGRDMEFAKVSQVIYPLMQIADIKHLGVDLVQAGMEQRKIHALGIEQFSKIGYPSPIFLHTPLIPSLAGPGAKMSSSEPNSMISIRDADADIEKKIRKAYCLEGVVEDNPILLIAKLIIFPRFEEFVVERPDKFGGNISFNSYSDLEKAFIEKTLHPADLKNAVSSYLIKVITPIRNAFNG